MITTSQYSARTGTSSSDVFTKGLDEESSGEIVRVEIENNQIKTGSLFESFHSVCSFIRSTYSVYDGIVKINISDEILVLAFLCENKIRHRADEQKPRR